MTIATIASILVYVSGLMMFAFGAIYCLKSGYMPYHEVALQTAWKDVPAGYQGIILGLMRSTGGGLIAGAFMISILQYHFHQSHQLWMFLTILIGGFILSFGAFHAMILFKKLSNGNPPMFFSIIGTVFFLIGCLLNYLHLK